jgi:hypothetical protein
VGDFYQSFTLTVSEAPVGPVITSRNSYNTVQGTGGSFTVRASGTAPITISLVGAPAGVSMSGNILVVANTIEPNTDADGNVIPYNFIIRAENAVGDFEQSFALTVEEVPVPPVITSGNFYNTVEGTGGSLALTASGTAPITFSLLGAPAGVSISGNNLVVSNTVEARTDTDGNVIPYSFTIRAQNAVGDFEQTFTLTVEKAPVPPVITSANSYRTVEGTGGSMPLTASGTAPIAFSLIGAPAGVSIRGNSLVVANTVEARTDTDGNVIPYSFIIRAQNAVGNFEQSFTLTVDKAPVGPVITSVNFYNTVEKTGGSLVLTASGTPLALTMLDPAPYVKKPICALPEAKFTPVEPAWRLILAPSRACTPMAPLPVRFTTPLPKPPAVRLTVALAPSAQMP